MIMPSFRLALLTSLTALAACAPFPEVDALGPDAGPPPALLPIDDLLSQAGTPAPDPAPGLLGRAARLKARASAIKAALPPG
jgi:hypothetical protein